jgi:hypothetical protein
MVVGTIQDNLVLIAVFVTSHLVVAAHLLVAPITKSIVMGLVVWSAEKPVLPTANLSKHVVKLFEKPAVTPAVTLVDTTVQGVVLPPLQRQLQWYSLQLLHQLHKAAAVIPTLVVIITLLAQSVAMVAVKVEKRVAPVVLTVEPVLSLALTVAMAVVQVLSHVVPAVLTVVLAKY